MKTTDPVVRFPGLKPRVISPPPTVERFEVVTPWVRVAVPLKRKPHAEFTAHTETIQRDLGNSVFVDGIGPANSASEGRRDSALELLLFRAELELEPAPTSRTRGTLQLEMEQWQWDMILELAGFYQIEPLAIVRAFLVKRLDGLRDFYRLQATARR